MRGLKDKVAVVVGASNPISIGAASATRLSEEGAKVIVADINLDGARAIAEKITKAGGIATAVKLNLLEESSIKSAMDEAASKYGALHILHVNAADTDIRLQDTDAMTIDMEVYDRTFDVGLKGHLLCTRYALPHMLKSGYGAIVYTGSDAAMMAMNYRPAYMMSKAGLGALARHVASRWGKDNIRANVIQPGLILTDTVLRDHNEDSKAMFLSMSKSPRLGQPEDIAAMAAFLASEDAGWVNGQVYSVNAGFLMR